MTLHPELDRQPLVYIIVLNWNQLALTLDCLASLAALDYPNVEVVLVDNGSTDGSPSEIRSRYPAITVIENRENLGFSEANNVGMRHALACGADYLLLLNNDTVVDSRFLTELVSVAEADDRIGVVGPKMYYYDLPDVIWCSGSRISWPRGDSVRLQAEQVDPEPECEEPRSVDFITACAIAVKRQVVERVGLLDPRYFIYYDEVDWCVRAAGHGYKVAVVPTSRIWHKVSAAMGATSPATDYYMNRNVLLFLASNRRGWSRLSSLARTAVRQLLTIAAYTARPHGGHRIPHRDARLLALRDAALGRWGKMGADVATACTAKRP